MFVPCLFSKVSNNEKRRIAEVFFEKNIRNRNCTNIHCVEKWCSNYLSKFNNKTYSYKDVVCALPEELLELKDYLDDHDNYDCDKNVFNYIQNSLYKNMTQEAMTFLYNVVGTKVCPYCNRNYVYLDDRVKGCDFDHYLPKSRYPKLTGRR